MDEGEFITRMKRRRRWPVEEKVRILEEAMQPGASVAAIADRYGMSRSLLFNWRRQARRGEMAGVTPVEFAPVRIATPALATLPAPRSPARPARCQRMVEITLTNGRVLRVDERIEATVLSRLVSAVEG
jgi:transposase